MNEILFLSGLLVAVSGLFLLIGYIEHQKAIQLMENMPDHMSVRVKNEGTDTD